MIIHGREIKFLVTVGAACELADMCPGKDIKRIAELLSDEKPLQVIQGVNAKIVHLLNAGYEKAMEFEEPGYTARPITVEELMTLPPKVFNGLVIEAYAAINEGNKTTVDVEPDKKNETQA